MIDQPPGHAPTAEKVRADLQELAQLLRQADHLEPETQAALADLVDELGKTLDPAALPGETTTHLAASAASLVEGLHAEETPKLLADAKNLLQEAASRAEAQAPVAADIVRRLLDIVANLGI